MLSLAMFIQFYLYSTFNNGYISKVDTKESYKNPSEQVIGE